MLYSPCSIPAQRVKINGGTAAGRTLMRKPTKKIIALLLMLAMALSLAACGSTDSGSTAAKDTSAKAEATPAPEFAYKAEFKNLTSDMPDGIAPLVMNDSGIYVATREKVGENIPDGAVPEYEGQYDIYEPRLIFISFDGTQTQLENYVPMKDESGNEGKRDYISSTMPEAAVLDKDGNIVLLERVYTAYSEAPDDIKADDPDYFNYAQSGSVNYIRTLDATGAELSRGIAELSDDDYIGGIALDENGNVVINTGSSLAAFTVDGEKVYRIDINGYVYDLVTVRSGKVGVLMYEGGQSISLRLIDSGSHELGSKAYEIPDNANELYDGSGDYDFYYPGGMSFFGYSLETESADALFSWVDCDVNSTNLTQINVGTDGEIHCFSADYNDRRGTYDSDLVTLTKVPYESLPQKEHLTLATVLGSYDIMDLVINFNRTSDKYHIDLKDYYEMTGGSDVMDAITKLNTEIMAGNVPDIIDLTDLPYSQLAAKGLLEDLYPYIDADPELDRDDFFPNVLSAYELDGGLYAAVPGFGIITAAGASSVVGDKPGWTYDDYYSALSTMPEGCIGLDYSFTKETMLSIGVAIDMDTYMSWSTGECNFDSDAFKQLLEFCDQFPSNADMENYETSEEDTAAYRIPRGLQMLMQASVVTLNDYSSDSLFGTDVTYIGFPNSTGEPGSVLTGVDSLAMSSTCADKDAAWQFLRTFLTKDYQLNLYCLPTNIAAFNELMDEAKVIEYEKDDNGNYKLDANGERIRRVIGQMYDGTNYTEIYSGITEERAAAIEELATTTTKLLNYDRSILDIVTEQAQAYFAGQKSADEVAKLVQSKANIYVNEQR